MVVGFVPTSQSAWRVPEYPANSVPDGITLTGTIEGPDRRSNIDQFPEGNTTRLPEARRGVSRPVVQPLLDDIEHFAALSLGVIQPDKRRHDVFSGLPPGIRHQS